MKLKRFLSYEWDAIAGIVTAVTASILNLLNALNERTMLSIVLALMALLFINFMRHTRSNELTAEQVDRTEDAADKILASLKLPDVVLVGPRHLRSVNEKFVRHMHGETVWFNLCLSMYGPQPLFDTLLRPAIENPLVSSIQFVLDEEQRELWQRVVHPRILDCDGHEKVRKPRWYRLKKNVAFILADSRVSDGAEALVSFWGKPFMAEASGKQVPRFIFHVQKHSELLPHLVELEHSYMRSQRSNVETGGDSNDPAGTQ